MADKYYNAHQVNETIMFTADLVGHDADKQLAVLCHALVVCCISGFVTKDALLAEVSRVYDDPGPITRASTQKLQS